MVSREWLNLSRRPNSQPAGGRLLSEHYKHEINVQLQHDYRVAGLTKYIVHTSSLLLFTHLVCIIYK